jgi:hypothetical protein
LGVGAPLLFANCGAQSESFVLSVEGSRRERRSGCRCHPNTSARTAQQPSCAQEQHLVVWPNGLFASARHTAQHLGAATHAGSLAPWPSRVDVSGPVNARLNNHSAPGNIRNSPMPPAPLNYTHTRSNKPCTACTCLLFCPFAPDNTSPTTPPLATSSPNPSQHGELSSVSH